MEKVEYLSSAYGSQSYEPSAWSGPIRRASNNTIIGTFSCSYAKFGHARTGYSVNPIHFITGTSTKWRNQSSYERWGSNFESITKGKYFLGLSKSYYVEDAPIDRGDAETAFASKTSNPYFSGSTTSQPLASNLEIQNAREAAILKAYEDLASAKANLGENLATLNRTADLFADTIHASLDVLRALKAVKNGKFLRNILSLNAKDLKRLIKSREVDKRMANYWLSYYYGWKPLYGDAKGLLELLQEQSKPALLAKGRGRTRLTHNDSFKRDPLSAIRPGYDFDDQSHIYYEARLTGRLLPGDVLRTLNRTGLLNAPALAWELIPFSFVVDWGVMAGSYLNAMTATVGLEYQDGSITQSWDRTITMSVGGDYIVGDNKVYSVSRGNGMRRVKFSNWPKAHLASKPFFTGAERFATIAALISNLTNGIKGYR